MSNNNQVIESAKIAAEAASSNTHITMAVTITTAILTAVITYKNVSRNAVVNTLTKERIEWLNKLRKAFSDFNELVYTIGRCQDTDERKILITRLMTKENYIRLLLNPSEKTGEILFQRLDDIKKMLASYTLRIKSFEDIEFLQQVILKAEWKRISIEAKKGKVKYRSEVNEIYRSKALEIDSMYAKRVLKYTKDDDDSEILLSEMDSGIFYKMKNFVIFTLRNGMYKLVYHWLIKTYDGLTNKQKNKLRRLLK
ncbi:hypothetical protein MH111_11780 [Bacillus altitudinis]|uniref:hypothetical protein n=1 Tax=Bacillus altitudinis TaxID=293387 RepID=UPI002282C23D|nr:hypothetical protein [Bacillus altitudinis]MCY7691125.1 hypothetical protein [Bacillus altitudinis]